MTEVKHTPTPWMQHAGGGMIHGADGYYIGIMQGHMPSKDAAHIVKCVNLHDELVEALQFISECNMTNPQDFKQVAREALKKAGAL